MQVTVDVEFVRNETSGRVHRVLRLDAARFKAEECNIDDIGTKESLTEDEALRLIAEDYGCHHCTRA